jgi:hypothetical protein
MIHKIDPLNRELQGVTLINKIKSIHSPLRIPYKTPLFTPRFPATWRGLIVLRVSTGTNGIFIIFLSLSVYLGSGGLSGGLFIYCDSVFLCLILTDGAFWELMWLCRSLCWGD